MGSRGEYQDGRTQESNGQPRVAQPVCPSLGYTLLQAHSRHQVCRQPGACSLHQRRLPTSAKLQRAQACVTRVRWAGGMAAW